MNIDKFKSLTDCIDFKFKEKFDSFSLTYLSLLMMFQCMFVIISSTGNMCTTQTCLQRVIVNPGVSKWNIATQEWLSS